MSWYKKTLLTVKDIQKFLPVIAKSINELDGVKNVYIWGSCLDNKNAIIKDIDILAETDFFSEDFLSIIDNETSPLKMNTETLENEGFNPNVVMFTKDFLKIVQNKVNPWVISNNKKILHWGAIVNDHKEWQEIKEEAEKYAFFEMNLSKLKLKIANQNTQKRWIVLYEHYINRHLKGIPQGWYELNYNLKHINKKSLIGDSIE